jgi:ribosome-binding protein aMBF1 (putative translation factor)
MSRYVIEIEPEVRQWLDSLSDHDYGRAEFYADLLADNAETLGEPYSRHLRGKVRELRLHLHRQQVRITYWLAPGKRVILLTMFYKTQRSEMAEASERSSLRRTVKPAMATPKISTTGRSVMSEHVRWERRRGRDSEAVRAGYEAAKRAYELGQAVRARRLELGMSQTELADRADMTQSAVSRLEAGGTVPTIGVLERLATALSADLVVTLTPKAA